MAWLEQVSRVRPTMDRVLREKGGQELDELCSRPDYDLFIACLAVAINQGIDDALGRGSEDGPKVGAAILKRLLSVGPAAYVVASEGVR